MAIRIGILSFAHLHAEGYQANLKRIEDVELVGFSHRNPEEGRYSPKNTGCDGFLAIRTCSRRVSTGY